MTVPLAAVRQVDVSNIAQDGAADDGGADAEGLEEKGTDGYEDGYVKEVDYALIGHNGEPTSEELRMQVPPRPRPEALNLKP